MHPNRGRAIADLGPVARQAGVAGPGGGTEAKPVGYVCICTKTSDGRVLARDPHLPGDRTEIRDRSTTVAMHLMRRVLSEAQAPAQAATAAAAQDRR